LKSTKESREGDYGRRGSSPPKVFHRGGGGIRNLGEG